MTTRLDVSAMGRLPGDPETKSALRMFNAYGEKYLSEREKRLVNEYLQSHNGNPVAHPTVGEYATPEKRARAPYPHNRKAVTA